MRCEDCNGPVELDHYRRPSQVVYCPTCIDIAKRLAAGDIDEEEAAGMRELLREMVQLSEQETHQYDEVFTNRLADFQHANGARLVRTLEQDLAEMADDLGSDNLRNLSESQYLARQDKESAYLRMMRTPKRRQP